jgi:hypothetical protein
MDAVVGLVVDPEIKFVGSHDVVLKIAGRDHTGAVDFDNAKPVTIDLAKTVGRMEELRGKTEGKMGE